MLLRNTYMSYISNCTLNFNTLQLSALLWVLFTSVLGTCPRDNSNHGQCFYGFPKIWSFDLSLLGMEGLRTTTSHLQPGLAEESVGLRGKLTTPKQGEQGCIPAQVMKIARSRLIQR